MTGRLRVERIEDEAGLLRLEPDWRALFAAAGQPSPFLDFDWLAMSWQQAKRRGGQPVIATVREEGELVLAIALERRRYRRWFHRYYGLSGSMPQYRDGLIRPADAADAARWINALRHGVRRTLLDSLIVLMYLPSHSPFAQALATTAEPRLQGRIAAVDLSGGYASYFAAFSGKTRSQIRRMERLLDPTGTVPLRLTTADTFDADFDWLLRHKRAWTPPDGAPLRFWLGDEATEAELRSLGQRWLASGRLVLGLIESGGVPIAALLCIGSGTQLVAAVTTYDPAHAAASPGRILTLRMIEWAAANGYQRFDFMGGRHDWKERLQNAEYEQYRLKLGLRGWGCR